jgi:hypothetical protein
MKAVIQRESLFDKGAYRYEPLTIDFAQISTTYYGQKYDYRVRSKYAPYAVATFTDSQDPALPRGNDLIPDELALRERFKVALDSHGAPLRSILKPPPSDSNPKPRAILPSDSPISMENILYTNNARNSWYTSKLPGREPVFRKFRATSQPFTAQTVLSASYGLMQVTIPTAVGVGYVSDGICRQPGNLFQETTNLDVGTEILGMKFSAVVTSSSFAHYADLRNIWSKALTNYNGGGTDYAPTVLSMSDKYFPVK